MWIDLKRFLSSDKFIHFGEFLIFTPFVVVVVVVAVKLIRWNSIMVKLKTILL